MEWSLQDYSIQEGVLAVIRLKIPLSDRDAGLLTVCFVILCVAALFLLDRHCMDYTKAIAGKKDLLFHGRGIEAEFVRWPC